MDVGHPTSLGHPEEKHARPLISPADVAQLALFAPYCGGLQNEQALRQVLPLLSRGRLEGARSLGEGKGHAFLLCWEPVRAPLTPAHCTLSFPGEASLHYTFDVPGHQLVEWLMHAEAGASVADLPDRFWQWLLLEQTPTGSLGEGPLH